ncbi:MAG: hypothetical protein IPP13_18680 [Kouleothrix sp.]|nr:hypothetical protein [Kouleothrix sp.]
MTDPYSRVRVLVTLRADFYDRPLGYSGFSALMRKRTEVVVPLSGEELRAAIVRPAERAGLRVDPELVEAIVSDVGEQPGALPLLQYALTEVVERRQGRVLTLTPYEASGGVVGALGRRAEELYSGLDGAAQEVTRQLFLRLVTLGEGVEDTRRRVRRTEVQAAGGGAGVLDGVIGAYAEYRLLTLDHDPQTRTPTVEVAHEALIRTWGRLRGWLAASREDVRVQRRLSAAAGEWAGSGGEGSFLASGARLEQLVGWARETHLGLNAEEQAYLAASVAARDAQQAAEAARAAREARLEARTKQVLRALVGVFAVAAVVAVGLSLYAFQQRGQARANEQRALAGEELAQTNANTAATAQANAERSAAEVQTLALSQGAQAAYNQGNIDLARQLALVAAQRPNADAFAEQTLASAVYNPGTQKVLSGHPDVVNSVVYSPDETMAFSGGRNDKTGILWDLKTGTLIKRFTGHDGRIRRVAFLPDGKRVLTGSEDGTIRLWDIACATPSAQECNTPVRVFVDHAGFEVKAIALRPNHNQFIAASSDKTLKLWDIDCATPSAQECNTPVRVFAAGNGGHTLEVNDAAFTSDGARMLSSSEDTTLVLWDVESGTPIRRMQHPNNAETRGVVILPGDQQALSTGANPDIIRWDLNSGQPIDRLRGHRGTVYSVAVSADGTRVLSSGDDNTVIEWDLQRGAPITFLRGHGGYIRQAVFSADGTHALSASADKTVRVWDLDNGAEQLRLTSADQVNTISLSADTKVLATGSDDGVARLWDLASGKPTGSYNWHERDVKSVALSPDGKYLLTGGGKRDGALILTNLQTGAIERKFGFTVFGTNSIAFTPDGTRAVTGQIIPGGDDYADDPTIDPELKNISLIVWDVASGAPIYKLTDVIAAGDRHDSINTVLITPDGTQIIGATGAGAQILIWDLETGKQLRTLDLNKGGKANDIALSADGKFLVAGSTDKTFMIWEVASGKVVFNSPPQAAAVTTVALNGDGTSVAVASETEVAIWDLRSGQKVRSFLGHRREIRRLLFTAGGHELVSASADGTTRVWRVETLPEIIAWSKEHRFFPGLTCEQLQRYNLDQQGCVSESAPTP